MYLDSLKRELHASHKGWGQEELFNHEECMGESGNLKPADLDRKIEALRKDMKEAREKEYRRITREFTNKQYGIKFNVELSTVVAALFGSDVANREISKSLGGRKIAGFGREMKGV